MPIGYVCDKNIVAKAYSYGGTRAITTTNTEKMGRTAREMTEAQRRSIGLANDGLEFISSRKKTPARPRSGSPTA
jgi:hypothetical protein